MFPHQIPCRTFLQLPTVQRLVNLAMLDGLHSLLWIIDLHCDVLGSIELVAMRQFPEARDPTVMIFFWGRAAVSSSDALRFPGLAASRTARSEGMVVIRG